MEKIIFKATGGMNVGKNYFLAVSLSWPLVKLEIFKDKIVLKYPFNKIEFKKKEINFLQEYRGFFSKGVQIHHRKLEVNKFIVFWSSKPEKILQISKKEGYKIKEEIKKVL